MFKSEFNDSGCSVCKLVSEACPSRCLTKLFVSNSLQQVNNNILEQSRTTKQISNHGSILIQMSSFHVGESSKFPKGIHRCLRYFCANKPGNKTTYNSLALIFVCLNKPSRVMKNKSER